MLKINPFKGKEEMNTIDPSVVEKYQHILSDRTRSIMALESQKRELEAKEARKQQLISAIAEASSQIDANDSDAQALQLKIEKAQVELEDLEKSIDSEGKRVLKLAQNIWNSKLEKAKKFNALLSEASSLWDELVGDLSQNESIAYQTAFESQHPIPERVSYLHDTDFDFKKLPQFVLYEGKHTLTVVKRSQQHPKAL